MATPSIPRSLTAHPDLLRKRAPAILFSLLGVALLVLILWVWLLINRESLAAEALEGNAGTVNSRVGSQFGVLIGIIVLPIFASLFVILAFTISWRWERRETGTRLKRRYAGRFDGGFEWAADLQRRLATGDPAVYAPMPAEAERGAVILDVYAAADDRVAYAAVGVLADANSVIYPIVTLSGEAYSGYERALLGR